MSLPDTVKTVIYLCFFDQPDKKIEVTHWQYWYNFQANPDQRVFDIGKCWLCTQTFNFHNFQCI